MPTIEQYAPGNKPVINSIHREMFREELNIRHHMRPTRDFMGTKEIDISSSSSAYGLRLGEQNDSRVFVVCVE